MHLTKPCGLAGSMLIVMCLSGVAQAAGPDPSWQVARTALRSKQDALGTNHDRRKLLHKADRIERAACRIGDSKSAKQISFEKRCWLSNRDDKRCNELVGGMERLRARQKEKRAELKTVFRTVDEVFGPDVDGFMDYLAAVTTCWCQPPFGKGDCRKPARKKKRRRRVRVRAGGRR